MDVADIRTRYSALRCCEQGVKSGDGDHAERYQTCIGLCILLAASCNSRQATILHIYLLVSVPS